MNWVCDDAWKGSFSQSLFNVGAAIGTLLFGYISDHFGRFRVRLKYVLASWNPGKVL